MSARLVEDLLTTAAVSVTRHGVVIANAVVVGSVDLINAEIPHAAYLVRCRFMDGVYLLDSHFLGLILISLLLTAWTGIIR